MSELSPERDAEMVAQQWRVRWHDYLPAAALVIAMVLAWLVHRHPGGMAGWGVSAGALAQGRFETIALHMFAHGGKFHLIMNSLALLEIGGLVTARLGSFARGWVRFYAAYGLAGLSSMIFFLSVNPQGTGPMIGASGAIYGLVGLLLSIRLIEEVEPVKFSKIPEALARFIENNLFFLMLLLIGGVLAGTARGVAWEAHLGGFLFGLCVGPWLLPLLQVPSKRGL